MNVSRVLSCIIYDYCAQSKTRIVEEYHKRYFQSTADGGVWYKLLSGRYHAINCRSLNLSCTWYTIYNITLQNYICGVPKNY